MTLCNCSDNAWNKQFPDAWLSETKNPLLAAIVVRSDGRLVFLLNCSASHCKFCKDGKTFQAEKKRKTGTYNHIFYCFVGVYDNFWDPTTVINTLTATSFFYDKRISKILIILFAYP